MGYRGQIGGPVKLFQISAFAALIGVSTAAFADTLAVQPVQIGQETIRYQNGVPTLDLEMKDGVVQITPLPLDHGSLSFGIAVYNDARQPANFGVENVRVTFASLPVKVLTKDDLVKKAENRAMWASIALAAVGGLSAAAAASQRDHYHSTLVTPRGTYRSYFSAPSVAGQFQAAAITAGTGVGIASIQNQLDKTVEALGDEVVQLTTVDPGESYAGRLVFAKIRPKVLPAKVEIAVNWNGETYPFTFQIAKKGTPAPVFTAITRPSHLTDFSQPPAEGSSGDGGVPSGAGDNPAQSKDAPAEGVHAVPPAQPSVSAPPVGAGLIPAAARSTASEAPATTH